MTTLLVFLVGLAVGVGLYYLHSSGKLKEWTDRILQRSARKPR